ncbi:sodium-coupled monocarboxylate transporter 2-like [Oratosquilla oratoria]|uniref:sodium-coupled monocarboxylate transporter 2-like n=1 Tax=Oratosquilla oratoria TaxID=337810 RepID=UPI003F7708D1
MTSPVIEIDTLHNRFTWVDYCSFGIMLLVSAGIGVFFGCCGKKQGDTSEFLMASKSMGSFPVAMSLIASFMSAITLLGLPAEIYVYGTSYWLIIFAFVVVTPATAHLYLPVFHKLQMTSVYEYLELRFSKSVRLIGSCLFITQMVLYMAIVVYAPALALSQVTGIQLHLAVSLICLVCIFYTTLGGIKAVLWTDTVQVVIMFVSMVLIIVKGASDIGGFWYIWNKNQEGHRIEIVNWDASPLTRHTIWSLVIGGYFTWCSVYGVNQAQVQRYLCVQTKGHAVRALWINLVGVLFLQLLCVFGGMVIYAKYWDCDPIRSGIVTKDDQLFPLFVLDTLGLWKGVPGLFVSGIFSGALSTVSSGMNSLAAITLEDFVKGLFFPEMQERTSTIVSKVLTLGYGIVTFALVFAAEKMGSIMTASLSIFGMVGGPLLGVFTLGMFFPWANALGALVGTLSGLTFTIWVALGSLISKTSGKLPMDKKDTSIAGCSASFGNATAATSGPSTAALISPSEEEEDPLLIFQLSYMWISAVGCFSVIICGMLASLVSGLQDLKDLDPRTVSPCIRFFSRCLPSIESLGKNFEEKTGLTETEVPPFGSPGFDNPALQIDVEDQRTSDTTKM